MPYQLAVALLLGAVLLVLVVFRLGQITYSGDQKVTNSVAKMPGSAQKVTGQAIVSTPKPPVPAEKIVAVPASAEKIEPVKSKGNNRIVIQTYQLRTHLEPVRRYFVQFGIETEIRKIGDWYYLVTADKYENPEKPGTDGYFAKQKIIELGAKYKAPPGYETFGGKPFYDAYGKKFDD